MRRAPKLTAEELSRVLGEADAGRLNHSFFRWDDLDCGCVAGAAYAAGELTSCSLPKRAWDISNAIDPRDGYGYADEFKYPEGPDAVLRLLESRGLA